MESNIKKHHLEFGSIVYANRYHDLSQREKFQPGHERGPFVVVGFADDKIIGAYCSSSNNNCDLQLSEAEHLFNRKKKTYVSLSLNMILDEDSKISYPNKRLSNKDIIKMKKKMILGDKLKYSDHGKKKNIEETFDVSYGVGDLVSTKNAPHCLYIIIKKNKDGTYNLLQIFNHDFISSNIKLSKVTIDCDNIYVTNENNLIYRNTIIPSELANIRNYYAPRITNSKQITISTNIQEGTIVKTNNNQIYYIYDIDDNIAHGIQIFKTNKAKDIKVLGVNYRIGINNTKDFNMNNNSFTIICKATKDELLNNAFKIKNKVSKVKDNNEVKTIIRSKKSYAVGRVISPHNNIYDKYVITDELKTAYKVISVRKMFENKIVLSLLPITNSFIDVDPVELDLIKNQLNYLDYKDVAQELVRKNARK